MKKYLINLPRWFRVWFGGIFIYMLGGSSEERAKDLVLFVELKKWLYDNRTH
jgi:hypothetical protein